MEYVYPDQAREACSRNVGEGLQRYSYDRLTSAALVRVVAMHLVCQHRGRIPLGCDVRVHWEEIGGSADCCAGAFVANNSATHILNIYYLPTMVETQPPEHSGESRLHHKYSLV